MSEKETRSFIGYAPIGSHGGLFYFDIGEIANKYPSLYEIYKKKLCKSFKKVKITVYK